MTVSSYWYVACRFLIHVLTDYGSRGIEAVTYVKEKSENLLMVRKNDAVIRSHLR